MGIAITKLFAQLLFWLYELLDNIFEVFGVLSGVVTIETNGSEKARSLLEIFLESDSVTRAFLMIVLIGIAIAAFSIIFAIVKNIINMKGGERKSNVKVVGQGVGAVITSMVMAVVLITGITLANTVLKEVYKATAPNSSVSISAQLFDMAVGKVYKYKIVTVERKVQKYDEENQIWKEEFATDENGKIIYDQIRQRTDEYQSGWVKLFDKQFSAADLDFSTQTPDDIFGVHQKDWAGIFEDSDKDYESGSPPMVEMDSFNFFLAYLTVVIMLVAIIWSMLGLVKRIYDLVLLFVTLPLISGTIPLDDGARFKHWRDSVVSKVALAYGVVLSINIFMLIMPIINLIDFSSIGWDGFVESLFKCFLLMGGALSINGGQLLIARLMGTSAEESREMAQSARALAGGVMAAGGMLRGAKNLTIGGYNKYGRHYQGIIPWTAEKADKFGTKHGENYDGSKLQRVLQKIGRVDTSKTSGARNAETGNVASNSQSVADASVIKPAGAAANAVVAALAGNMRGATRSPANNSSVRLNSGSVDKGIPNNQSTALKTDKTGSNVATGNLSATKPNAPHAGLVGNMLAKDGKSGGGYTKTPKK